MTQTVEQLRNEIAEIDRELAQAADTQAKARDIMDELALPVRRGDAKAAKKLAEYEGALAEEETLQRRRQAARAALESELSMALALEKTEENKVKAREAKETNEIFRKRGADLDAGIRAFVDNYKSLRDDAAALTHLGVRAINSELVRVNTLRALSAALQRTDLGLPIVPPLQRHSFAALVEKWASMADRHIAAVLGEPMPPMPPTNGHDALPAVDVPPPVVIDATDNDPNFTIKPAAPRS